MQRMSVQSIWSSLTLKECSVGFPHRESLSISFCQVTRSNTSSWFHSFFKLLLNTLALCIQHDITAECNWFNNDIPLLRTNQTPKYKTQKEKRNRRRWWCCRCICPSSYAQPRCLSVLWWHAHFPPHHQPHRCHRFTLLECWSCHDSVVYFS